MPAINPLKVTMRRGSLAEILRVKLLSNPQNTQAAATSRAPAEKPQPWELHDRKMLAAVMIMTAMMVRLLIASRKNNPAIKAVATVSKFSNNEAVLAGVVLSPIMEKIGAMIPPARMAPINQGISWRERAASRLTLRREPDCARKPNNAPRPLPIYNKPARGMGST